MSTWPELLILGAVLCVGVPLNVYALCGWFRRIVRRKDSRLRVLTCADELDRIECHRIVADLIILLVYVPTQIADSLDVAMWFVGGDLQCQTVGFLRMVGFYASSNTIVCIALVRLAHLVLWKHLMSACCRLSTMLAVGSWLLAFACSTPQIIWFHVRVMPWGNDTEIACVSDFQHSIHYVGEELERNFDVIETNASAVNSDLPLNDTSTFFAHRWDEGSGLLEALRSADLSVDATNASVGAFYMFHMLTVFWIPAACLTLCYVLIVAFVCCKNRRRRAKTSSPHLRVKSQLERSRLPVLRKSTTFVVVYCLCWSPYNVITMLDLLAADQQQQSAAYYLHHLMLLNCVLNPLIYRIAKPDQVILRSASFSFSERKESNILGLAQTKRSSTNSKSATVISNNDLTFHEPPVRKKNMFSKQTSV